MIGFHLQESPRDWPRAVAKLPPGAPNKFLDGVQRAREAKAANPGSVTVIRHHVGEQPRGGDLHDKARRFFASFVDDSFLQIAQHVDWVQEWNEYFADSQGPQERGEWVAWCHACADVWAHDYRKHSGLRHIRLILAETAVGNNVPVGVAKIAHDLDCAVGYHPYVPVWQGQVRPDAWRWYSGRWETMDAEYRAAGYHVPWFFGEFGAVGHNGPGWPNSLAANDGWRHPDVYGGNLGAYLDMMRQWLDRTVQTTAYREGRVIGATLFTSGGGRTWRHYEVAQPEMDAIAEFVSAYMATAPRPGTPPPPDPPPVVQPPPATDTRYKRVVNLLPQDATIAEKDHVVRQVHDGKESIMQSADDAGFLVSTGRADSFVRVWGVDRWGGGDIQTWLKQRYGAASHAAAWPTPQGELAVVDVVDSLPRNTGKVYHTRPLDAITHIVIHHTVGAGGPESIASYHVNTRDWPGIGYHYVITQDGTIYQTNRHETMSFHVAQANGYCLGVALVGDFRQAQPSAAQLNAARQLVAALRASLPNAGAVVGHRDLPGAATACPGDTYGEWLPTLR